VVVLEAYTVPPGAPEKLLLLKLLLPELANTPPGKTLMCTPASVGPAWRWRCCGR
jgi:hypothetical protein